MEYLLAAIFGLLSFAACFWAGYLVGRRQVRNKVRTAAVDEFLERRAERRREFLERGR